MKIFGLLTIGLCAVAAIVNFMTDSYGLGFFSVALLGIMLLSYRAWENEKWF